MIKKQSNFPIGSLIISNPCNPLDGAEQSVMVLVSHTPSGSVGIQINRVFPELDLQLVCDQQGIWYPNSDPIYLGGPINTSKVYVIHSSDWASPTTVMLNDEISLTHDTSVLAAIARGKGPGHFRACAGFWSWPYRKLQEQLQPSARNAVEPSHRWEFVPSTLQNVFRSNTGVAQWRHCLSESAKIGVKHWMHQSFSGFN
jgi:putative transcriptional regulator